MAKSPDDRFAGVRSLVDALEATVAGRKPRPRRAAALAAAGAAALLGGGLWLSFGHGFQRPGPRSGEGAAVDLAVAPARVGAQPTAGVQGPNARGAPPPASAAAVASPGGASQTSAPASAPAEAPVASAPAEAPVASAPAEAPVASARDGRGGVAPEGAGAKRARGLAGDRRASRPVDPPVPSSENKAASTPAAAIAGPAPSVPPASAAAVAEPPRSAAALPADPDATAKEPQRSPLFRNLVGRGKDTPRAPGDGAALTE